MIFVDTGAFAARYLAKDQHHGVAVEAWRRLEEERARCVTTIHILDETLSLVGRRAGHRFASERARSLFASRFLRIERPGAELERAALGLFEDYADQKVSFTDCLSFAVMKNLGIERTFTFDAHFRLAGFEVWP